MYQQSSSQSSSPLDVQQPQLLATDDINQANSSRELNGLLLLGSLLFVAAGIAFVTSGFANEIKLIGLIVIVSLFYVSDIVLYSRQKVLRPAAVAFIGTA